MPYTHTLYAYAVYTPYAHALYIHAYTGGGDRRRLALPLEPKAAEDAGGPAGLTAEVEDARLLRAADLAGLQVRCRRPVEAWGRTK